MELTTIIAILSSMCCDAFFSELAYASLDKPAMYDNSKAMKVCDAY